MSTRTRFAIYVIWVCSLLSSCTHKNEGLIVKDIDGNVYRLDPDSRAGEAYNLVPLDSSKYNVLFNGSKSSSIGKR